jgi:hypothetical protein
VKRDQTNQPTKSSSIQQTQNGSQAIQVSSLLITALLCKPPSSKRSFDRFVEISSSIGFSQETDLSQTEKKDPNHHTDLFSVAVKFNS